MHQEKVSIQDLQQFQHQLIPQLECQAQKMAKSLDMKQRKKIFNVLEKPNG